MAVARSKVVGNVRECRSGRMFWRWCFKRGLVVGWPAFSESRNVKAVTKSPHYRQFGTRPCQERKDGAPTVSKPEGNRISKAGLLAVSCRYVPIVPVLQQNCLALETFKGYRDQLRPFLPRCVSNDGEHLA